MLFYRKFVSSVGWSFIGEVFGRLALPLTFLILAKILVPKDFGVVSAALVLVSFSQIFWDAGIAKALIQTRMNIDDAANSAFWLNCFLGLMIWFLLYSSAGISADFFNDPRIRSVIKVLSVQSFLASLCSVQIALLQRAFRFKELFWTRFLNGIVPSILSVVLALKGFGYWSLVYGSLFGQLFMLIAIWRISEWRPRLTFDINISKSLLRFGRWPAMSALFGWFYVWMDAIIVGRYLGTQDMGVYRTGSTFVSLIFGLLVGPLLPVLYSLFSSINDSMEEIRHVLSLITGSIILFVVPIAFGILALSSDIEIIFFTSNWTGIQKVIGIFALVHGFSWTISANGEAYRAIGKPQLETIPMALMLIIYLMGYLISINYGLVIFLKARLVLTLLALPLHWYVAHKYIHFSIHHFLFRLLKITFISTLMYGGIIIINPNLSISFSMLILQILMGLSMYLIMLLLIERPFLKKIVAIYFKHSAKK